MATIKVEIKKQHLILLSIILTLLAGAFVIATSYSALPANFVGHTGDNIWIKNYKGYEKRLQPAMDNRDLVGACHWERSWTIYPTGNSTGDDEVADEKTECNQGVCMFKFDNALDSCSPSESVSCKKDNLKFVSCGLKTPKLDEWLYCCPIKR